LQKAAIEQAYHNIKLLGEIGQDITSSLSVETIIDTVHKNLDDLMDATVFWIGIHKPERNMLSFTGGKEKGETLPYFELSLDDEDRLAVYCFKNKSEVWVNDYPNEYHKYLSRYRAPILGDNPHSIVYLPLIIKAEIIGVITVQSFIPHAYTQNHINILKTLAVYAAIGLENALLYENLEKKVAERTAEVVSQKEALEQSHGDLARAYENVKMLGEIGLEIASELSTDKIIEKVYESVNALMDASYFAIGILSESRARIEFRGAMEKGVKLDSFTHSMADENRFSVWAVEHKKEVLINDFSEEYNKYISGIAPPVVGEATESIIYLPLVSKGVVIGVLTVQSFSKHAYNEFHLNILRNMAIFLANAIENAEAYRKIESQHEEIKKAKDKMTASINYARRIQNAMLPDRALLEKALPESFVFFRPRDIVSGDFYWLLEKDHKTYVAVVDCTGHGVPGAFMSMIGSEFLSETVNSQHIESPELILEHLHLRVRQALKQSESDNRDGMDVALCVIDHHKKVMEYAGACSPLIYITGSAPNYQLHQIKGDRMPIGGMQREVKRTFTKHTIPLDQSLMCYMLSDGFQDQFGGPNGKKYSLSRLKEVFLQHHTEGPDQQRKVLRNELVNWIRNERQIDDILVLGFRLIPD
jgi:serine phosphatase RsbU (regulator of sigma subunit)/GAF domain-containing protein